MQFLVRFADGDERWQPFTQDLWECEKFEAFCAATHPLSLLNMSAEAAADLIRTHNKAPIDQLCPGVAPGVEFFCPLRSWGPDWFDGLSLPDSDTRTYVVKGVYGKWNTPTHTRITTHYPVFHETFNRRAGHEVWAWGTIFAFDSSTMVLVDEAMLAAHPEIKPL